MDNEIENENNNLTDKETDKASNEEVQTPAENIPQAEDIQPNELNETTEPEVAPEPKIPLQSIGEIFSRKREELGITIPQVVETTKIRSKYLAALEDDNFKAIPNLLAARGFIKIYGNYLGLDIAELVDNFNKRFPEDASTVSVPNREVSIKDEKYRRGLLSKSLKTTNASSYNYSRRVRRKKSAYVVLVTLGIILLIGAIIFLSNHYLKRTVGDLKKEQRTKNDLNIPTAMITPEELKNRANKTEVVFVTAKATNRTWARVVVDGRVTFSGNLDRGNSKTWTGDQYISIKASRPDRLELIVNGKFAGTMGTESVMKESTFYLPKLVENKKKSKKLSLKTLKNPIKKVIPKENITTTSNINL